MKKLLFIAFALALSPAVNAQTYTPVAVTGFNADVIAEGTGTVASSTTNDVDGVNYTFMAQGYTNPSNITTTRGLPTSGTISSVVTATPGLTFQLAPYNANNSLRINGSGTGMLTFPTPIAAEKVYVLATSGSGTSNATITVTFTDASTEVFTQTVNDWYGGVGYAINGIGRANSTTDAIDNNTTDPRLYQYELALRVGNITKQIQSISFTNSGSVLNVMGITVKPSGAPAATDAGVLAITSPASPLMQNTSLPVQVLLVNQGSTSLTSANITWSVDGTSQPSFAWTGNLSLNQTATVLLGNFTFSPGSHTVMARATNPNNGTDGFPANDSVQITLNSCNILAGTYTINQNSPASATNFQSIGAAATALNSCGISGPVVFNVVAGSGPYTEQIELQEIAGASATNTITFNGNNDTIQANPASASRHVIKLNGADYVTISNFTILTTGTTTTSYGWGIHFINGANNNTISNNIITIGSLSTSSTSSMGIVFSNSSTSPTIAANNGNNNLITGNTINGGYRGISIYGIPTETGNNQITNNTIRNFYSGGIELNSVNGTLVEGNDISRPSRTPAGTFDGVMLSSSTRNSLINKNRIHASHGAATSGNAYGIYSSSNDAPAGSENIVTNNLIYDLNTSSTIYGVYNSGSNGIYYYHNTINLDNTSNTGTVRGFYQLTAANNIRFKNNIVNVAGGTSGAKHAIYFGTTSSATIATDIESDNNVLNVTGGSSTSSGIGYYSGNKTTLADWRTASGDDTTSVVADPVFTSITTGNFLPTATAVNNIGVAVLPAVTHDITGALRNPLTPDPGAYEIGAYVPAGNDAGVTAISSPNSGCSLTAQETITITINNFGTASLSNIPVWYTINGGTAVTETFAGPLASGATATYTFTATANLSAPATYNIVASTNVSGDALASNDSFTKAVIASAAPATPAISPASPAGICAGGSVVLTATSATTGATFTWFSNGTLITGATGATYTATAPGNYTAVASANGCSSSASSAATVTLNPAPAVPAITAGGATTFCAGDSVILTAASTTPGVTYAWFNNGTAITGATAATYSATTTGNYTVVATAAGCSSTASTPTVITVNALPATPTITRSGFMLTSSSATDNQWYKDGTQIAGATNATYTTTANGVYTVVVTTNNCSSAISNAVSILNTGISEAENEMKLAVYPNPSSGIFNIAFPETQDYKLFVTDLTGKVLLEQSVKHTTTNLDLSTAAKGIYLLKIVSAGKTATRKLVVE